MIAKVIILFAVLTAACAGLIGSGRLGSSGATTEAYGVSGRGLIATISGGYTGQVPIGSRGIGGYGSRYAGNGGRGISGYGTNSFEYAGHVISGGKEIGSFVASHVRIAGQGISGGKGSGAYGLSHLGYAGQGISSGGRGISDYGIDTRSIIGSSKGSVRGAGSYIGRLY